MGFNKGGGGSGGSGGSADFEIEVTQANDFDVGNAVYEQSNGVYAKAVASAIGTANAFGIVTAATTSEFTLTFSGFADAFGGLTAGKTYYVHGSTAGDLTDTAPAIIRPIVNAISATSGFIFTDGVFEESAASAGGETTEMQYNSGGILAGDSSMHFDDGAAKKLTVLNLAVEGTLSTNTVDVANLGLNHIDMNTGNTTLLTGQTGSIVVNISANVDGKTTTTTGFGDFTAGSGSTNPTVTTAGSGTFAANEIIQITGTAENNDGFFEVLSHVLTTLTIKGVGATPTVEKFTSLQFTTDSGDTGATITKVLLSVIQTNTASGNDGLWGEATASQTPFAFQSFSHGGLPIVVGPAGQAQEYQFNTITSAIAAAATAAVPAVIIIMPGLYNTTSGEDNNISFTAPNISFFSFTGESAETRLVVASFGVSGTSASTTSFHGMHMDTQITIGGSGDLDVIINHCHLASGNPLAFSNSGTSQVIIKNSTIDADTTAIVRTSGTLPMIIKDCTIKGKFSVFGTSAGGGVLIRNCYWTNCEMDMTGSDVDIDISYSQISNSLTPLKLANYQGDCRVTDTLIDHTGGGAAVDTSTINVAGSFSFSNIMTTDGTTFDTSEGTILKSDGIAFISGSSQDGNSFLNNKGTYTTPPGTGLVSVAGDNSITANTSTGAVTLTLKSDLTGSTTGASTTQKVNGVELSNSGEVNSGAFLNDNGLYQDGVLLVKSGDENIDITTDSQNPSITLASNIVGDGAGTGNQQVNGVKLEKGGAATQYLNRDGGYSVPASSSGGITAILAGKNIDVDSGVSNSPTVSVVDTLIDIDALEVSQTEHGFSKGDVVYIKSEKAANLLGGTNDVFSTPDNSANDFTNEFDIRVDMVADDWNALTEFVVIKGTVFGTDFSYGFGIRVGGQLTSLFSSDGSSVFDVDSIVPSFVDGSRHFIRATGDNSSGDITFYESSDGGDTWDTIGAAISSGFSSNLKNSADNLTLGGYPDSSSTRMFGKIFRAQLMDSIDGSLAVDFNPEDYVSGGTFSSSATNETWTLNGNVTITTATDFITYELANADDISTANAVGIVTDVTDVDNFVVSFAGYQQSVFTDLIPGETYYLAESDGGKTTTAPTITRPIFNAITDTDIFIFSEGIDHGAEGGNIPFLVGKSGQTYSTVGSAVAAAVSAAVDAVILVLPGDYTNDTPVVIPTSGISIAGFTGETNITSIPSVTINSSNAGECSIIGLNAEKITLAGSLAMKLFISDCEINNALPLTITNNHASTEVVVKSSILESSSTFAISRAVNNASIDLNDCNIVGGLNLSTSQAGKIVVNNSEWSGSIDPSSSLTPITISHCELKNNGTLVNLASYVGIFTISDTFMDNTAGGEAVIAPAAAGTFFFNNITTSPATIFDTSVGTPLPSFIQANHPYTSAAASTDSNGASLVAITDSSAALTVTLLNADIVQRPGREFIIKDEDGNASATNLITIKTQRLNIDATGIGDLGGTEFLSTSGPHNLKNGTIVFQDSFGATYNGGPFVISNVTSTTYDIASITFVVSGSNGKVQIPIDGELQDGEMDEPFGAAKLYSSGIALFSLRG